MHEDNNRRMRKRRWPWIVVGSVLLLIGAWQLFTNLYPEEERELRRQVRETVKEKLSGHQGTHKTTIPGY